MERAHGSFARSLRLPYRIDANQVQASFTDGVLSITIPKPQEALQRVQRIEVKRAEGPQQPGSQGQSGAKTGGESPADNTTRETTAD